MEDVRFGLRVLARSPGYAAAALCTLALGIGANAAVFSLVYGVLLSPLPYRDGHELVLLKQSAPSADLADVPFSIPEFRDYRDRTKAFSSLVEYHGMNFTLLGRGEPEQVTTGVVSWDFFDVLGVRPLLGRTFGAEDEQLEAEAVLVLSHGYWRRSFGADPNIVGQIFEMNNRPHRVVGVLPAIPQFPVVRDVYMPTSACPFRSAAERTADSNRGAFRGLLVLGRIAPDAGLPAARADLSRVGAAFPLEFPDSYPAARGYAIHARPLKEQLTQNARPTLLVLWAISGLILLLACANVANLTFSRALRRERELALRTALGASRWRLVRQALVEATVLSSLGGVLGLSIAYAGLDLLVAFVGRFTPRATDVAVDGTVLAFTASASLLTGLLFGAAPALSSIPSPMAALRDGGRSTAGRKKTRLRAGLVAAQVASSAVVLVGAGLMLRSLDRLQAVDVGFEADSVLTAELPLNFTRFQTRDDRLPFFEALLDRLEEIPSVTSAALGSTVPLDGAAPLAQAFQIEGRPLEPGQLAPQLDLRTASPGYFRTLGIPLVRGRVFDDRDGRGESRVVVINQSLARRHWGDEDPVGTRISRDGGQTWETIVGVVGDVKQYGLDQSSAEELYTPVANVGFARRILVRTNGDPARIARDLKNAVYAVEPNQPVSDMRTLEERRSDATASPRLTTTLLAMFAVLALLVTAAGVGGVVAFSVSQRTPEIGVRVALGASRADVVAMVARQGMIPVALGILAGLGVAAAGAHTMSDLLFETDPRDPATLAVVATLLVATSALACALPAYRATRVDPTIALRSE